MTKLTKNSIEELEARLDDLYNADDEDRASWESTIKEIEALLDDPTHDRLSRSPLAYEELEMMIGDGDPVVQRDLNKADKLERGRYIAENGPCEEIVVRIRRR